jgi:acyl carrier protein phosphodiesterase
VNFLAHIYLSGDDEELMLGNFIADFVKGKKKNDYPPRIRKGIELHRMIDDFTDHHPITSESKARLRPGYGKYAGVIVDLYYDHFLAAGFSSYSGMPLKEYSENTYRIISGYDSVLPEGVRYFLPFMIEKNWLLNYATIDGIGRALSGLSKRVSFENRMDESVRELRLYYEEFRSEFDRFFPELITFAASNR